MTESVISAPTPDLFEDDRLANGPIVITYYLSSEISIQTTVVGTARNAVNISIFANTVAVWSGSMSQFLPEIKTTGPIIAGNVEIEEGATFKLTPPSGGPDGQPGSVMFQGMIKAQGTQRPFSAQIATWTLSS